MKNLLGIIVIVVFLATGCAKAKFEGDALIVTHSPNPSNKNTSEYFPNPPYPYTWYYRTEVKNNSDRELKVIWFEGYGEENGHWYSNNVLNRTLRNDVFMRWYGDERAERVEAEWLKPGESRACDPNWHADYTPSGHRVKWAFIAIDRYGNDYFAEAVIESVPIKTDSDDNNREAPSLSRTAE